MSCFEEIRQVAVTVGRRTTTVFGEVHRGMRQRGRSLLYTIGLLTYCITVLRGGCGCNKQCLKLLWLML